MRFHTFSKKLLGLFILISIILYTNTSKGYGQPSDLLEYGITFPNNSYIIPKATDAVYFNGIIYIDPQWTGTEKGTLSEPYNSWESVNFSNNQAKLSANTAYLQKRNTEYQGEITILADESNVLIGAYGEGDKPIIKTKAINLSGYKNVIRDLHIKAFLQIGSTLPSGSYSWVYNNELNGTDHEEDLLVVWTHHNKIIANYLHDGLYEGIFMKDDINGGVGNEVAYNYIKRINKRWYPGASQAVADGDGIQVSTADSLHIHHNIIDRGNSGNKFCIIVNDESNYYNGRSIYTLIEHNVLILPRETEEGGAGIYLGAPHNSIIRYNRLYSRPDSNYLIGIYASSQVIGLEIYGNLIVNTKKTLSASSESKIIMYNNTCINTGLSNEIYWTSYKNNITTVPHTGLDPSNIFTDAIDLNTLFIDPDNYDYRLKKDSPAIDVGVSTSYSKDIIGDPVPADATDAGAYEYLPNKSNFPTITLLPQPELKVPNENEIFLLYPNPAPRNNLSINLVSDSYVKIIDLSGRILLSKNCQGGLYKVDCELNTGNYIMQVTNANTTMSKSFIIL